MAKFTKVINIWDCDVSTLQPGQWVNTGKDSDKGIFCGVKPSGSVVVAWHMNAKNRRNYREYVKTLFNYAKEG